MAERPIASRKLQPGFTLPEVLLALVVIALLAVIVTPVYQDIQTRNNLDVAEEIATQTLRRAQVQAKSSLGDSNWGVNVSGTELTLFRGSSYAERNSNFDQVFELPSNISSAGTKQFVFSRFTGTPTATGTLTFTTPSNVTRDIFVNRKGYLAEAVELPVCDGWTDPIVGGTLDLAGAENGSKVAHLGDFAYLVRNGGTPNFAVIDISTSSPVLEGSLTLTGTPQNIFVQGDYAYVATNNGSAELQIIDISTPSAPTLTGSYDDTGTQAANGVYVSGTIAYVTFNGGDDLVTVNVATPSSPSALGTLTLAGNALEIIVIGDHAYISSTADSEELQIVNVSTPSSLSQVGSLNLDGGQNANTITGFETSVVVGRVGGEVALIDVSTPSSPSVLETISALSNVNDFALGSGNACVFTATDDNNTEFQVITISDPSFLSLFGSLNDTADINGITYDQDVDTVYAAGEDDAAEFIVYEQG